ncbi:MAG: TIGR01777 family protein [Planctomycetes bacterium]|nr:TIGR01777 family protein [Planctomycetota bacterium]
MKIAISGSNGLLGSALVQSLREGEGHHTILRLLRKPTSATSETFTIHWLPTEGTIQGKKLNGLDAVVHLAGDNIASGRWTKAKMDSIRLSRVMGTKTLCDAIAQAPDPPKVLVCASAVGFYGNRGDEELTEQSPPGKGFLADVCKQWEAATLPAVQRGVRVVYLRFGAVISPDGGAIKKMLKPFEFGVGGTVGSGKQYIPWVSLEDAVRVIELSLNSSAVAGPINVCAPDPVTNKQLTKALGAALGRPTIFPLPGFVAKMIFGSQMAEEVLLASTRAVPRKLMNLGFQFKHTDLEALLKSQLRH